MKPRDRTRRVLLVIPGLGGAGAENQLAHLALGLAERGHDVTVAAIVDVSRDIEPLRRAGVRIIDLGARTRIGKLVALPRLIRLARRAEVVHCGLWDASLWARLAGILARRPVVVAEHSGGREIHRSRTGAPRGRWIAAHNRVLSPFTFATVVCASGQVALLEREGVDSRKIIYLPNGVPIEALRAAAAAGPTRATLGIPDDAAVVVHVARLEYMKNQRQSLDTVARLRGDLRDVRLLLVGGGSQREELERYAGSIGADWALFLGRRHDVPGLLAVADLAVLPSLAEGMPMSLIEATALGVPIVANDVGDMRRNLEETGAGVWVSAGDGEAFYQACRRVLTDPTLMSQLARRGRTSRLFDAETMIDRYAALFEAAVAGEPPSEVITERAPAAC